MPELIFEQDKNHDYAFEIEMPMRNGLGEDTGVRKTFASDNAETLCVWYEKNAFRNKPKSKKKNKNKKDTGDGK